MHYTEQELSNLIQNLEKEFTSHLAKAEEETVSLSKSEDSEEKEKKHAKDEHEEEHKEHEEHEPEHKEHEEHAEHEPKEEHEDHAHDYDDEDMEHMHKMYMSMSKGELAAHHDAIKKAHEHHGLAKCIESSEPEDRPAKEKLGPDSTTQSIDKSEDDGIEACEPKNSPGAKSPDSNANGEKINKSDVMASYQSEKMRRNGGQMESSEPKNSPGAKSPASDANGAQINKSEGNVEIELLKSEIEAEKAKNSELKKNFDAVQEFLTKLVKKSVPQAKAITSLGVIAKSEGMQEEKTLTKSEISSILLKKSQDPTLSKKDREAINSFYLENGSIEQISHLLK